MHISPASISQALDDSNQLKADNQSSLLLLFPSSSSSSSSLQPQPQPQAMANPTSHSLNGLLNIVKSIGPQSQTTQQQKTTTATVNKLLSLPNNTNTHNTNFSNFKPSSKFCKDSSAVVSLDSSCSKCLHSSRCLCSCNISRNALTKLYQNVSLASFNSNNDNLRFACTNTNNAMIQNKRNGNSNQNNNFVISYERFVSFENDTNTEKIFQVL